MVHFNHALIPTKAMDFIPACSHSKASSAFDGSWISGYYVTWYETFLDILDIPCTCDQSIYSSLKLLNASVRILLLR